LNSQKWWFKKQNWLVSPTEIWWLWWIK
jgi:hypothetical protein